jgi:hypothetical protein
MRAFDLNSRRDCQSRCAGPTNCGLNIWEVRQATKVIDNARRWAALGDVDVLDDKYRVGGWFGWLVMGDHGGLRVRELVKSVHPTDRVAIPQSAIWHTNLSSVVRLPPAYAHVFAGDYIALQTRRPEYRNLPRVAARECKGLQ